MKPRCEEITPDSTGLTMQCVKETGHKDPKHCFYWLDESKNLRRQDWVVIPKESPSEKL